MKQKKDGKIHLRIIRQPEAVTLLDNIAKGNYIIVDAEYRPLLDEIGQPYRSTSLWNTERIAFELVWTSSQELVIDGFY